MCFYEIAIGDELFRLGGHHDAFEDSRRHVEHGQPSLCLTCRYATVVQGRRLRDGIVECSRLGERVRFPASSCNVYIDRTHPTIREMEDVDYVEGTKKKGLFVDLSTGI